MNSEFSSYLRKIELNSQLLRCTLSNYGARLLKLEYMMNPGQWQELTAGFDSINEYTLTNNYFGAICGRYANRICEGRFELNKVGYQLDVNHRNHHLHGGKEGFHNHNWSLIDQNSHSASFKLLSPHDHMGYPGNLEVQIRYELSETSLLVSYSATTDKDTVLNIAPHYYFNLSGEETIYNHELQIHANCITEVTDDAIPTGSLLPIYNTSLDFSKMKPLSDGFRFNDKFVQQFGGFDHNFVLQKETKSNPLAASLYSPANKLNMNLYTSQPGLHLYTCNWADRIERLRANKNFGKHSFICLESQHFPDSPNHQNFPTTVLKPNDMYKHFSRYEFVQL